MDDIKRMITEVSELTHTILQDHQLLQAIQKVIALITDAYRTGNKVVFCGNGGSAAEAQHLAAELSGKFRLNRTPLPAEACHVNSSFITAVSNDYSFSKAYARYIEGFCRKGDILLGMSTSGESKNIIEAFQAASKNGLTTIALTGKTGGLLASHADFTLKIPSVNVARIQEIHLVIGHIICESVEKNLFAEE